MGILKDLFNQTRKPDGFLGKMIIKSMNFGHAKLSDWGMKYLKTTACEEVIDLGCGGGRNTAILLKKYPKAIVTAVDYSPLCVEQTMAYNKAAIEQGRCKVIQADVSDLPLPENRYDLATAFETIYFWPGLETCFKEVAKVLRPGGRFMIVNESDGFDEAGKKLVLEGFWCNRSKRGIKKDPV